MINKQSGKTVATGIIWLAWSGGIAIAGIGGFFAYTKVFNTSQDSIAVSVMTVELGEVKDPINVSGTVQLGDQQTLKSPVERGVVERVQVQVNDTVNQGQLLITLRDPTRETALLRKQLAIQTKELQIINAQDSITEAKEKLQAAKREIETATLDGEIELRKQELQMVRKREKLAEQQVSISRLEAELQEREELFERGFIAEQEVQEQQEAISRAKSTLRDSELEIQESQLEFERVQRSLEGKQDNARTSLLDTQAAVRQAQINLRNELQALTELRLDLRDTEQELEKNFIRSTINGRVMEIQVKVGDVVESGKPLLTLGNPAQEEVILQLNTLDAVRVKPNQKVIVSIIGPNAEAFTGEVQTVSQIVASSGDNSSRGGGSIAAMVKLDRPSESLIPNSQVDVEIIIEQRENVIALATELIQRSGEEAFVWVRNDQDKAEKRTLTLGLEGVTTIEVKSGLKEGEQVILLTPDLILEPEMSLIVQGE